jgi:hypothetical protein
MSETYGFVAGWRENCSLSVIKTEIETLSQPL